MSTTAQQFFPGIVDDDQTGGTTVKKIAEISPATTSTTTNTWTTATVEVRTHVPLAASSVATDTSSTNGWSFNNGGADGLGSVAGAERWIKAGVWSFSMDYTLNAPALLQTIACTVTARVYRVATGGGARTPLFTAASANFSATGVITWNSASQPEYVLAPGEVIQVGFTPVSRNTVDSLSAITNTVLTLVLGPRSFFNIPAPGVRTLALTNLAASGVGALAGVMGKVISTVLGVSGVGVSAPKFTAVGLAVWAATGLGTAAIQASSLSATVLNASGSGVMTYGPSKVLGSKFTADSGGSGGPAPIVVKRTTYVFDD